MKQSRNRWIFLLGILLVLGGHALSTDQDIAVVARTGLAFGAFDITESDLAVTHVTLLRIKPASMYMGSSWERATVTYTHGEFFSPNLSPGLYTVNGFF